MLPIIPKLPMSYVDFLIFFTGDSIFWVFYKLLEGLALDDSWLLEALAAKINIYYTCLLLFFTILTFLFYSFVCLIEKAGGFGDCN